MSKVPHQIPPGVDPDSSPFEAPPISGMPYEKGSEEDLAIRRILEEADADHHRHDERPQRGAESVALAWARRVLSGRKPRRRTPRATS